MNLDKFLPEETKSVAPGSSSSGYNIFFPYLHLTEKGKKEIGKW